MKWIKQWGVGLCDAPRRMNLNPQEQAALVAFMETLTDKSFLTDPKFSDPFVTVIIETDHQVYLPIVQK